jgi:hypothetical protein
MLYLSLGLGLGRCNSIALRFKSQSTHPGRLLEAQGICNYVIVLTAVADPKRKRSHSMIGSYCDSDQRASPHNSTIFSRTPEEPFALRHPRCDPPSEDRGHVQIVRVGCKPQERNHRLAVSFKIEVASHLCSLDFVRGTCPRPRAGACPIHAAQAAAGGQLPPLWSARHRNRSGSVSPP